jgi:hypothetical protein
MIGSDRRMARLWAAIRVSPRRDGWIDWISARPVRVSARETMPEDQGATGSLTLQPLGTGVVD